MRSNVAERRARVFISVSYEESEMCQLAAYVGDEPTAPLLLRAIELQEPFFGAHASGLAVLENGVIKVVKDCGHVSYVKQKTNIESLKGSTGIAHSRYSATVKDDPRYNTWNMAHPFLNETRTLALMHNGIITDYEKHWKRLKKRRKFSSYSEEVNDITDSEVAVHMLDDSLSKGLTMELALSDVTSQLKGSFLFCCIKATNPDTIWIANWYQPCVVAVNDKETMFCSSNIGFKDVRDRFDRIFEPPKNSIVKLKRGNVEITPLDSNRKIPNLKLNKNKLGDLILKKIKKKGEIDFRELWWQLHHEGWAEAYGISNEQWKAHMKNGVDIVNPFIEVIQMLLAEGKMKERIDRRLEGGVSDTPRFSYYI